jgi:putative membrane protein
VATIDKNEIIVSEVAANKTNDTDVANLAKMMIVQHGSNLAQILSLSNNPRALAVALSSGIAGKMLLEGNSELATLGILQGKQFDQAYANAMVTGHEAVLHLIDTQLMKTATTEEIKKFLTDTRAVVVQHLDQAKALQKKLNS